MDAIEYLTGKRLKMHEVYASEVSLTFCTAAESPGENLSASLSSIYRIASEIGFPFEIILVTGMPVGEFSKKIHSGRGSLENLYIVREKSGNTGSLMRAGFDSSSNKYFVPFRSNTAYDIRYADLIHSFLMKREKKLFLSELPVIHRDLIRDAGGYRALNYSYDIDLYSRIAIQYGLVAYPSLFNQIPIVSPPPSERNEDEGDYTARRSMGSIKDHIIACNYGLEDLLTLYLSGKGKKRTYRKISLFFLYALSKVSRIKPYKFDRNNYLILMENVFESLILRDFARYEMPEFRANMILTGEEIRYLKARSRLYKDVLFSMSQYVIEI